MAQQLQQIMALPLGRTIFAVAIMAPVIVLYLAVTINELRKQLAYQLKRVALARGEINTAQLLGLEPMPDLGDMDAAAPAQRVLN